MIPRMLLQKLATDGLIPKSKLRERFANFADGRWITLFVSSREAAFAASISKTRRARRCPDSVDRKAERAREMASV